MSTAASPKRALMAGAAWNVAMRWSVRILGLANTLIMARLLMPADYGIVAMAMLVVGLIQALLDFGATTALLRRGEVTRDEIDSTWSLRLLQALAIGACVALMAWPASLYFEEPRVVAVLLVLAVCIALNAFSNIGLTLAQKALNFSLEFRFSIASKLLGVLVTVTMGWWLGDYRALVCGIAAGYLGGLVLSYTMHPYRPRWNTTCMRTIWHETKWLMFAGIAQFLLRKGDELVAARIGTAQSYGVYNVGSDLGQMPTGEIGPAILKAFLPVLATIQADWQRTNLAVIKTVSAVTAVTAPIGLIFAALCEPATRLLLGPEWQAAAVFIAMFSVVGTLQVLGSPLGTLLVMRGHAKVQGYLAWGEFAVFALVAVLLTPSHGLLGLGMARIAATCGTVGLSALATKQLCQLSIRAFLFTIARPLVGACLAAATAWIVSQQFDLAILQLLLGGLAALATYFACSALSWVLAGRPEGLESTIIDYVAQRRAV